MVYEPLAGRRHVHVSDQRTCLDFARVIAHLVDVLRPDAEKIVLIIVNLGHGNPRLQSGGGVAGPR